jgi:crotonobetainyl-CoA:carnitine CoA-transferase CaiB-like acyl-CoA transferase
MMSSAQHGPLAGIKVVDFGQYVAGPGAALMLADQGASVIRVDPPNGPAMPGPATAVLNRGKKGVVLDLKRPEGVREARALIERADVVVENFRPRVMERLGLGPHEMMAANPGLVYLSLPGFSEADPDRCDVPAWEGVVAAAMGQFTDMGLNRVLMGIEASYSPLTLASAYAAVFGALSVVLALRARLRHGRGERIEVALAAALMEGLAYNSLWIADLPQRYQSLREREIARRRAQGLPMNLAYEQLQTLLDPFYKSYQCRDGRRIYVVCSSHATHPERALKLLGVWDEMVHAGLPCFDPYLPTSVWPAGADCTLRALPMSQAWTDRLAGRMAEVFLTRDSFEWERLFGEAGVPAAVHRTTQEWIHSDHPKRSGLIIKVHDPHYGDMRQPGPVAWLPECPPVAESTAAPIAGPCFTNVIATDAAASPRPGSAITGDSLRQPWLEGLKVLDLTNVIAGPTVGGTLARFGARVIKIDSSVPSFDPWTSVLYGIYANRGKESALADLRSPGGKELLRRLVPLMDVITINATSTQLERLGLDFEQLRQMNPRVILCHLDAFGGPRVGPRSDYPGYDDLVQASTGIMARFGGSLATVEEHAHVGTIDVLAGLCGAFATSLALWRREQTGKGEVARTSLAAAGQWLQVRFMYDFQERSAFNEPSGREAKGEGSLYRCYRAADGWLFFAAREADVGALDRLACLRGIGTVAAAEREAWLTKRFATMPRAAWVEALATAEVAVQPLEKMSELREREALLQPDGIAKTVAFVRHPAHPSGHEIKHIYPNAVRVLNAQVLELGVAERYGASTRAIAQYAGLTPELIETSLARGDLRERWSEEYLPS